MGQVGAAVGAAVDGGGVGRSASPVGPSVGIGDGAVVGDAVFRMSAPARARIVQGGDAGPQHDQYHHRPSAGILWAYGHMGIWGRGWRANARALARAQQWDQRTAEDSAEGRVRHVLDHRLAKEQAGAEVDRGVGPAVAVAGAVRAAQLAALGV